LERLRQEAGHNVGNFLRARRLRSHWRIQRYIKLTVADSGAQLLSTQALPIADETGLITATIRVGLRGENESVQALLYRLEAQQPLAHVDNVSLRALAKTANAARRGQQLDMRFELTSYVLLDRP
jgi:hypothetical protein